ncbi:2-succinyl-5-enolpyruvyl-6-hydroxy-3-cyclohexene-1-carboxylic-acid synthase [bacterium]|nr:2-succinyl-5-enolpyruvyl-6-hydroxy-3-cyclohexene-1-carboxylic-acid synthase [bacterium]
MGRTTCKNKNIYGGIKGMKALSIGMLWGHLFAKQLYEYGVTTICIAPGSRSTCLVKAIYEFKKFKITTHFDERSLAFYALGAAKYARKPTAIITTSGSAVANLLPALVEAKALHIPILCITADRPPELHNCGANQTLKQDGLLSSSVVKQYSSEVPAQCEHALNHFLTGINDALQGLIRGPVHINIPFREPFLDKHETDFSSLLSKVRFEFEKKESSTEDVKPIGQRVSITANKNVLCVIANTVHRLDEAALLKWSKEQGIALLSECNSSLSWSPLIGRCPDSVIKWMLDTNNTPDVIICIGGKWISKMLHTLLAHVPECVLIHDFEESQDWLKCADKEIKLHDINAFQQVLSNLDASHDYYETLTNRFSIERRVKQRVDTPWNEASCLQNLSPLIERFETCFVGNSKSVRCVNSSVNIQNNQFFTMTQRGLSGIDGLISTACGITDISGKPAVAILGDLSFLYDVNGLAFLTNLNLPLMIIILNNNGGRIFESLPVKQEPSFESLFVMPQRISIKNIAQAFKLDYEKLTSKVCCDRLLASSQYIKKPILIECNV